MTENQKEYGILTAEQFKQLIEELPEIKSKANHYSIDSLDKKLAVVTNNTEVARYDHR